MTREEQIVKLVDDYKASDPVANQLLNRNAAFGLVRHVLEWADSHPAWVSVEERLPIRAENSFTFSDYVLVCDNTGYMDTACYNFEKNRWDWLNNITHWMPLPQLPVKKGGEQ